MYIDAEMNDLVQSSSLVGFFKFRIKLYLFFIIVHSCYALYEDQIGKFDWRQQYIGKVKFAYIDPAIAGTHKFHVATHENVLACLSTRTGSIIWRQVLEKGEDGVINALSEEGDIISVSGNGQFIRSWDPNTGVLLWETAFPNINRKTDAVIKFFVNTEQKEIIMTELHEKSHAQVAIYSYTRASIRTSEVIKAPFMEPNQCKFLSSQYLLCLDEKNQVLYLLSIKETGSFLTIPLKSFNIDVLNRNSVISISAIPHQRSSQHPFFALQIDSDFFLFQILPPRIRLKKKYPNVHKLTSTFIDKDLVFFSLVPNEGAFSVLATVAESDEKISYLEGNLKLPEEHGELEDIFVLPYVKRDQKYSFKLLLSTSDDAVLLVHQQSRIIWVREESLANIVSVEIFDLPLSEMEANIEQEFGDAHASLLAMLYTRLKSQMHLLETFLHYSFSEFQHSTHGYDDDDRTTLARDTFGLHKVIVVVTRPGKVFGMDNLSGQIVWSHYESKLRPFVLSEQLYFPVFVQRTTAHFPYPPQCTVFGHHENSNKTHLYSFNPITGKTVESKVLPYAISQLSVLGATDNHYLRGIIILDHDLKVHVYPESASSVVQEHPGEYYVFTADTANGILTGYVVGISHDQSLFPEQVWRLQLPNQIVSVVTKRPFEHVHSQGRVMGDRSVLYKYLNPNLAAVFTEGSDSAQKSFCNVYLIDVITGLTIYSASHKKCKRPIKIVHSENWVIYSYYNDKSRREEVSSIELFEGVSQSNTTAFSSFAPPPLPLIEHQTFIFPSSIETMIDTVTERGLTNKHILIGLPIGSILELPKTFLDPRRPINPTPDHREEGLIPYIPELPIMADKIINYNQSIQLIRGIQTAPSNLESTCLVFAYGLDLFYTRVTPSKTFDILKEDFDHYLISAVLLGLLLLSYTTKRLAARKSLKLAWK